MIKTLICWYKGHDWYEKNQKRWCKRCDAYEILTETRHPKVNEPLYKWVSMALAGLLMFALPTNAADIKPNDKVGMYFVYYHQATPGGVIFTEAEDITYLPGTGLNDLLDLCATAMVRDQIATRATYAKMMFREATVTKGECWSGSKEWIDTSWKTAFADKFPLPWPKMED